MKRNSSGKVALIVLAVLIVFSGMIYVLFMKATQIGSVAVQVETEISALETEKDKLEQLEMLESKDNAIMAYINTCAGMMPNTPDESALIDYIQSISNEALADVVQIKFEPRVQGEKYAIMPLSITFEGKYADLVTFLDKVRTGSRAIRVDGIDVALTEGNDMTIKTEIYAKAFYLGSGK